VTGPLVPWIAGADVFAEERRDSKSEYEAGLDTAGFERTSVESTHEVADRMHGAINKASKTTEPEANGLPMIQPAATAGCC